MAEIDDGETLSLARVWELETTIDERERAALPLVSSYVQGEKEPR
jgi:hypothetical protein